MFCGIQKKWWLGLVLATFLLWIGPVASAQQASALKISAPIRDVIYEDTFTSKPGIPPKWDNGYLLSWNFDTVPSDTAENLMVYDRDGKIVGKTRIWLPDATLLRIVDADARKDGNVAVVGWAMTGNGDIAAFLADVSILKGTANIVRTSPFEGRAVTFGPDGTIWLLGLQSGPGRQIRKAPDHYMVQQYATNDTLKSEYMLRSAFPCKFHPAQEGNGRPQMAALGDRIGFFAPACRMWVELSPTGELLGRWQWKSGPLASNGRDTQMVSTVTLTSTNELYAGIDWPDGIGLYHFDRPSSTWTPVDTSAALKAGVEFMRIAGNDGDTLVYWGPNKKLAWSNLNSTVP